MNTNGHVYVCVFVCDLFIRTTEDVSVGTETVEDGRYRSMYIQCLYGITCSFVHVHNTYERLH